MLNVKEQDGSWTVFPDGALSYFMNPFSETAGHPTVDGLVHPLGCDALHDRDALHEPDGESGVDNDSRGYVGGSSRDSAGHAAGSDTTECVDYSGGGLQLQPRHWRRAAGRHPHAHPDLHALRHHAIHHRQGVDEPDGERVAVRAGGNAPVRRHGKWPGHQLRH